jgi:hypothetical protein
MMKLVPMIRRATKKPAPERAAKTGLTWALWALVRRGKVDGGTGIWPPIGAIVVDVVVVVGAGVVGVVPKKNVRGDGETMAGWTVRRVTGVVLGCVAGAAVVAGTLGAVVRLGWVMVGPVRGSVVRGRLVPGSVDWGVVAAAARSGGEEPAPTRTAAIPAAATPANARFTYVASRRRTPSIVAAAELRPGTPSVAQNGNGAAGTGGRVTRSPGRRRFGSAGLGRLGRLTCTTCHQ